ncbi:MAG: putative Ig domain-containing protein, partial [Limisphaerales bacterium]
MSPWSHPERSRVLSSSPRWGNSPLGVLARATALLALACGCLNAPVSAQSPLTNGGVHTGAIEPAGDSDNWTFTAPAGASLMFRVGATNLTPRIRLFGPSNELIQEVLAGNSLARDGFLVTTATNAGNHTVVVSAGFGTQTGTYGLHWVMAPGSISVPADDQGGEFVNGSANSASLTLGDLDPWHFTAQAGEEIVVRMGATSATPWLRVFGPSGALVAESVAGNSLARDGFLSVTATNAGNYLVVASAAFSGQSGGYTLHLAQSLTPFTTSAGDEGGTLANGAYQTGVIELGDLDLWRFTAQAGESIAVRMGATNVTPWLRVYAPTGEKVAETTSGNSLARDGFVSLTATNAGTYLVVAAASFSAQSGGYGLHLAQAIAPIVVSPGDEGDSIPNGATLTGTIDLGDLDVWRFQAGAGNSLFIRMGGTNITPWLRLFGPSGLLIADDIAGNTLARDVFLTVQATNAGPYTLVGAAAYSGQSGGYSVNLVRVPDELVLSPGDEGGTLINGQTNVATLSLGDLDTWSFFGTRGDSNVLRVISTGFTPWIRVHGPDGSLVGQTTSGNSLARAGAVNLVITNEGLHTITVAATYGGQSGTYTFKQSRFPPDLVMPDSVELDESAVLNVPISAQDPDEPNKPLAFQLLSAPAGVELTLQGATNALLAWNTSEADGPSTNLVVASVTDVVNGMSFTRTNSFQLIIHEVNTPPVLVVPQDQTLDELTPLSVTAAATDVDLPANPLRFTLLAPPDGMTIDPATGAIRWTPTEAQGPSTQVITVAVSDENPSAINSTSLSTTNQFTVVVREINTPPTVASIPNGALDELTPFAFRVLGTDADLPANPIAFRLLFAPAGMTIDPTTGDIAWIPSEAQGPSTQLIGVVVSDSSPAAANTVSWSITNAFELTVREVNLPPTLATPADRTTAELAASTASATASDSDIPVTPLTFRLLASPTGMTINPNTGEIAWTPTESQGPSTNRVVLVVSEAPEAGTGVPGLSVTNSFEWIVTEQNTAPVLEAFEGVGDPLRT